MSNAEETIVVGNSGYTPLDHRENTIGKVQEDRPEFQRKADQRWQPVKPYKSPDELRIEALEQQIEDDSRQAEYNALKTDAEKELFGLRERVDTRQAKSDEAADKRAHEKKFETQLTRLNSLRAEIIGDESRKASELAAVDHAIAQFVAIRNGACDKTAHKMLADIEQHETNRVVSHREALAKRRDDLRAEAAKLDAELGTEPEIEDTEREARLTSKREAIRAHYAAVNELVRAGEYQAAEQLREQGWQSSNE